MTPRWATRTRRPVRVLLGLAVLSLVGVASQPARAASPAPGSRAVPSYPVPRDCTPVAVPALTAGATACVHDLLVTDTTATAEQNSSQFNAVDSSGRTLHATVPNWWPSGGPVAGMVVTLWGNLAAGTFKVDHWIELNHGSGPAPAGPYPRRRLLDVAAGKYPALEMAWVIATTFALDPQNPPSGDGDIHVQTTLPCPTAGLTFETTRTMRGYVDHPGFNATLESTNQKDAASLHEAEAPPAGVPVMMLGQLRVDFGFGWWEVHPVRAWRFLTSDETAALAGECANAPVPVLDNSGPGGLPLPFGAPPCTDGSEFGNPGSTFKPCSPHCYVATTAIGRPQTTAGHCKGVLDASSAPPTGTTAPAAKGSPGQVGPASPGESRGLPGTTRGPGDVAAALTAVIILALGLGLARRTHQ